MIQADNWERIQAVFLAAADLPYEEQAAFVDVECGGDLDLQREVESLLAFDSNEGARIVEAVEAEAQSLFGIEPILDSRLGAYRVVRELGRGGMGTVYLAARDDDQYEKQVAIKLIRHGMDTADVLDRFRHERQILANLDHPYISRLIDGGTSQDGRPFLVMEYVEGEPIDAYCSAHDLDIKQRCRLLLKVCEAVAYAHRNLVIHRDLKPGNVVVTHAGSPKLLDFGVAKLLTPDSGLTATMMSTRPMTPDYASPEQVSGMPVTTATDVYSLGVVFYELLTRSKARSMQFSTLAEMERVICNSELPPPSAGASGCSSSWRKELAGDLDNIVLMAVRKEPERRYQSVDQFAQDIQRYLDGHPVQARKDSLAYRVGKLIRRQRFALAAAVFVFASLVSGIVIARSGQKRAEQRLTQLVELANHSLFDVHKSIERLPGATAARREIVRTTLQYLENLSKDAAQDDRLRLALSAAYFRLGDIQGYQFTPNLGDTSGALQSYRKAAELIEPLHTRQPKNPEVLTLWIDIQRRTGFILDGSGAMTEALKTYRNALPGAQLLARLRPDQIEARQREGLVYEEISVVLANTDTKEALEFARRQLAVYGPLTAAHPGNAELLDHLSDAHGQAGKLLNTMGDLRGALEEFRKCVAIREQAAIAHPNDVVFKRNLMLAYGHVAGILGNPFVFNLGDSKAAREYYGKATAIAREVARADPSDRTAQYDLASVLLRYAAVDVDARGIPESLAMLKQADEILAAF